MGEYRLKVHDGHAQIDDVSFDASSLSDVRRQIVCFVAQLMKDDPSSFWTDEDWRLEVSDDTGLTLYILHLSVAVSSALSTPFGSFATGCKS